MRLALALAVLVVGSGPGWAAGRPVGLLHEESLANDLCRGGAGSENGTNEACELRDLIADSLKKAGWCHGRPGETESQMMWHPCGH